MTATLDESLSALYTQYVALNTDDQLDPETKAKKARQLRAKIRDLGGSVRTLAPAAEGATAPSSSPKPKKLKKTPKTTPVHELLTPATEHEVNTVINALSAQLTRKTVSELETLGLYGLGIDLFRDPDGHQLTAERYLQMFKTRFGKAPEWFAVHDSTTADAAVMLVLGPVNVPGVGDLAPALEPEAEVDDEHEDEHEDEDCDLGCETEDDAGDF